MTAVLAKGLPEAAATDSTAPDRPQQPRRSWTPVLRLISPLVLLVLWQVLSSAGIVSDKTLASPAQVVAAAAELWSDGSLQDALAVSLQRVLLGAVLGILVAVLLGVLAGFSRIVELAIDPPIQMLRTVPFLGLIPCSSSGSASVSSPRCSWWHSACCSRSTSICSPASGASTAN